MLNVARVAPHVSMDRRSRLKDLIAEQSVIRGREMRLASGGTTNIYFNLKKTMFDPEGSNLIAEAFLDILKDQEVDCIGGLAMGAVPIIAAVCVRSISDRPIPGFFVRKEIKEHGTKALIDGRFEKGSNVVLLDDVTTTGGSVLVAVRAVRENEGHVSKVITLVDRQEGARENLEKEGIELMAVYTKDEFPA